MRTMYALLLFAAGCLPAANIGDLASSDAAMGGSTDLASSVFDLSAAIDGATSAPPDLTTPADLNVAGTCADKTLLFCEDFEGVAAGAVTSSTSNKWASNGYGTNTLTIDTTHAVGKQSLHINITAGARGSIAPKTFVPSGNNAWGRMRAWVTAFPTSHFSMIEAAQSSGTTGGQQSGSLVRVLNGSGSPAKLGTGSDGGNTGDWAKLDVTSTTGKFVCYEFQFTGSNSQMELWVDGVADTADIINSSSMPGTAGQSWGFPTINEIWFGIVDYDTATTTYDVWIDDIAIGPSRIGC